MSGMSADHAVAGTGAPTTEGHLELTGLDAGTTRGHTGGMTVKLGISLSDDTHAAAVAAAEADGLALSTFVDRVLARELYRRSVEDHNQMLREAGLADPDRLARKVDARQRAIAEWKAATRAGDGGAG